VTPEEMIEQGHRLIHEDLKSNILDAVKSSSPVFFERLVVNLLISMGYGGSIEAGKTIGRTGDGGIDGIINEDVLGFDVIHIQAKRWKDDTVGAPEIQKFAGALEGKHSKKGIFITTSTFSEQARNYIKTISSKIILIDGMLLSTSNQISSMLTLLVE
jgi:restriction system protein